MTYEQGREQTRTRTCGTHTTHLLGVEVLRAVGVLFEQLTAAVPEKLVVGNLQLKRLVAPLLVKSDVIRMDEGELLVCERVRKPG